ncbi:hypothetical protein TIFTF001_006941 [Ficus carica]|uniref:Uncharacterized protein n=1 Tax=Ficus carica TaxID=3494 RepID=A0AA87ZP79_FICCA|nr:hypothetical protein TIFTF001_006941 [Ficus carica]
MLIVYHIIIHLALYNPSHSKSSPSPAIFPPPETDTGDHLRLPSGYLSPAIFSLFSSPLSRGDHLRRPTAGRPRPPPLSSSFSLFSSLSSSPFSPFSSLQPPLTPGPQPPLPPPPPP